MLALVVPMVPQFSKVLGYQLVILSIQMEVRVRVEPLVPLESV